MQNDQKRSVVEETQKWLFETFPACFKRDFSLPLKVGIVKDIFEKMGDDTGMSRIQIRRALQAYTNHPWYQRALASKTERVDLDGQVAGSVEEEHKIAAEKNLAYRRLRSFARKKTPRI